MAQDSIRVQPSELTAAASKIVSYRSNYIDDYNEIINKVNNLTSTSFGGADAEAFAQKVQEFKKDFIQMENILQEYINFLNNAAEAYKNAQSKVVTSANNLSSKA